MGSFRSTPQTIKDTQNKKHNNMIYGVSHMCGWRIYMQDAHISTAPFPKGKNDSKCALFGIFDGHGGPEVSTFVQRHFQKQLQLNQAFKKGDYQTALKQTFLKMDQLLKKNQGRNEIKAIQKQMSQKGNGPNLSQQQSHAGCTANVVLITQNEIYTANAGDSRAVSSVNGKCVPLSFDHKPQDPQQIKRIQKAGGKVVMGRVNGNLNLSRAIGDLQYKQKSELKPQQCMITAYPDVKKIDRKGVDFIIMGCDGIWQIKSNQQMVDWIKVRLQKGIKNQGQILQELLDELVAKDKGSEYGMDNMSAILIRFQK